MAIKHHLTTEEFLEAYQNKFHLALQMIHVAQSRMDLGEDVTLGRLLAEFRKEASNKIEETKKGPND